MILLCFLSVYIFRDNWLYCGVMSKPDYCSCGLLFILAMSCEKVPSSVPKMCGFTSSCTCTKFHLDYCSSLKHSIVYNDSVCGQWRPWSDCTDVQADLGLHCPHKPDNMLLHEVAHVITGNNEQIRKILLQFNQSDCSSSTIQIL